MPLKTLTDWFDQVHVINCIHRPNRLEAFKEHIVNTGIADLSKINIYHGVSGYHVGCPPYWKYGPGAWGCLQSHRRLAEDVMGGHFNLLEFLPKRVLSYLVLEDDVFFVDGALEMLNEFMEDVPDDWGQLYLGGQHRRTPLATASLNVIEGASINRLHAYAVHERNFLDFYAHISNAPDYIGKKNHHIDHQVENAHRRKLWKVYCPAKWIAGQRAGISDICRMELEDRTWNPSPLN